MTTINEVDANNALSTLEAQVLALGSTLERLVSINGLPSNLVSITQPYDSEGGYYYAKINGVKTQVYTKFCTGALYVSTAYGYKYLAHGLDNSKIVNICAHLLSSKGEEYLTFGANGGYVYDHNYDWGCYLSSANDTDTFQLNFLSIWNGVSNAYKVKIDYTV